MSLSHRGARYAWLAVGVAGAYASFYLAAMLLRSAFFGVDWVGALTATWPGLAFLVAIGTLVAAGCQRCYVWYRSPPGGFDDEVVEMWEALEREE